MSNPSTEQLLAWMKDRSCTYGWGALIAYDRRKTNELLQQLYIERFSSGHYLPLINESMTSGSSTQHLSGLRFSVPLMSFESASLGSSTVSIRMDFVGGMIVTEEHGFGISRVQKILPLNRPRLTLTQPLERVEGLIDGDGVVALNLANKQGANFNANFVLGALDQAAIGRRFQVYFQDKLDDDQRIFPLGTLAGEANEALTPAGFSIRTMAAPGATVRGAPNEGDGAVLVFARMKDRFDGNTPGADFMYPIPADAEGKVYTGTMWLSSRALMDDLIRPDAMADIGNGIEFEDNGSSSDLAVSLRATAGGLVFPQMDLRLELNEGIVQFVSLRADWNYQFARRDPGHSRLLITSSNDHLHLSWKSAYSTHYAYKRGLEDWPDDYHEGDIATSSDVFIGMAPVLDADGVVHFEVRERTLRLQFKSDRELPELTDEHHNGSNLLNHHMRERIFPAFEQALQHLSLPSVDTFLLRNLLFPGHNALQPTDVHLPGDLVLLGHIDPLLTRAIIAPRHATLEAGGTQQFSLGPGVSGVTWSVRGTDPDDEDVGSISSSGLYKGPTPGALFKGYLVAVITGRGTLDGQEVLSSAMVTVLASTVAVNPVFQVCGAGDSVELSAEALGGDPLWSLKDPALGGSVSVATGSNCTYTAGALDESRDPVYLDTVLAGNPGSQARAEALVLVRNAYATLDVVVDEDSGLPSDQVQVQVMDRGVGYNPDDFGATCRILTGGGSLSPSGLYEQAADASGYVVVVVEYVDDFAGTMAGFLVLPLPLPKYQELNLRVSRSIRRAAEGKAKGTT